MADRTDDVLDALWKQNDATIALQLENARLTQRVEALRRTVVDAVNIIGVTDAVEVYDTLTAGLARDNKLLADDTARTTTEGEHMTAPLLYTADTLPTLEQVLDVLDNERETTMDGEEGSPLVHDVIRNLYARLGVQRDSAEPEDDPPDWPVLTPNEMQDLAVEVQNDMRLSATTRNIAAKLHQVAIYLGTERGAPTPPATGPKVCDVCSDDGAEVCEHVPHPVARPPAVSEDTKRITGHR